jgi:hypothetical protein
MHHIRPYRIFTLVQSPPPERLVSVKLPQRVDLKLLETFLLIAAIRIVNARRVFEFGTFLGSTTLNLALNLPDDGVIFTLDLDDQLAKEARQHPADVPITRTHLASKRSLDFMESDVADKVKMLTGDSTRFDFSPWKKSVDLVFIDGGHDLATVKCDTENALELIPPHKPACILWHDYLNPDYGELSSYLEDLSRHREIFHVEDTMLCAWFNDPGRAILPRLLNPQT